MRGWEFVALLIGVGLVGISMAATCEPVHDAMCPFAKSDAEEAIIGGCD